MVNLVDSSATYSNHPIGIDHEGFRNIKFSRFANAIPIIREMKLLIANLVFRHHFRNIPNTNNDDLG